MTGNVYVGAMSPTGGTAKVAAMLCHGLSLHGVNPVKFDFLTPAQRALVPNFEEDDMVIFCFPVFTGRVPKSLTVWPQLHGHGSLAVVGAVYGNRACDDAPREMAALLQDHGFKVIAAAELLAQHSLEPRLAEGRPDAADAAWLSEFARQLLQTATDFKAGHLHEITIDRAPYKPYSPHPHPIVLNPARCRSCKVCSRFCPQQLIAAGGIADENELTAHCINCQACVARCPYHNRALPPQAQAILQQKMEQVWLNNQARKENRACFGQHN